MSFSFSLLLDVSFVCSVYLWYSRLHDEIVAYVDYMTPTPEEEIVVAEVGKRVRGVLAKPFRNCQVHTAGSTASGLRLPERCVS